MPKPLESLLKFLFGPIFWGAAFVTPLMAALMVNAGLPATLGLNEIQFALILGTAWGTYAHFKGAWL